MDTDQLLNRFAAGHSSAATVLFNRHEERLRRMIRLRFDPRLGQRLDPSDVVQETMVEAHRRLPEYVDRRPLPFYPWLRGIAWDRLIQMTRRHVHAQKRTVSRETRALELSGDSQMLLADQFVATSATPSDQAVRNEIRLRVQQAITRLPSKQHEVVVLKHLEELSVPEIAAVLNIDQEAVYSRYRRAVGALHDLLRTQ